MAMAEGADATAVDGGERALKANPVDYRIRRAGLPRKHGKNGN